MIDIFIPVTNIDIIIEKEVDGKKQIFINDSVITWLNENANGYDIIWNTNDHQEEGCIFRFLNREDEVSFLRECVLIGDD